MHKWGIVTAMFNFGGKALCTTIVAKLGQMTILSVSEV